MSEASPTRPAGSIYDLGYRNYEGLRLGRRYAFTSLFTYTLLSIWGINRSWLAKLFPFGLAVIALLPAVILLAIAALAPAEFELARPEEFFGFISIILALFCAVAAPELVGRDHRHHTLSLYFSRALDRVDYAAAKLAALTVSLFTVVAAPQVFLQAGNAVAADDLTRYLRDNIDVIPPVLASSALVAVTMASVSMAVAIQTSRRAFSTAAIIAAFVVLTFLGGVLVETLEGTGRQLSLLVSPILFLEGAVYWIFNATPEPGSAVGRAGLEGHFYFLTIIAYVTVSLAVIYRRIKGLNV